MTDTDDRFAVGVRAWAAIFAVAALVVRLPFLFGEHQVAYKSDGRVYLDLAHGLYHGDGFSNHHFWTPGYPAFEGLLELFPGRTADTVVVGQHLLGVALVAVIVVAAWRYFGRAPALLAGALAALSPVMVIQEHRLLPDFLFGVLVLAGALALAEAVRRTPVDMRLLVAAGVIFGLAAWVKPLGQFLFVAALPALLFASRDVRRSLLGTGVVGLALLVTISPWVVRNVVKFDLYSMTNQGNETLFYRAFDVDRMPIPRDQQYGRFAELIRKRVGPGGTLTFPFHYALVEERGLTDDLARATEGRLARVAVRRHPWTYLSGTVREIRRSAADLNHFEGRNELLSKLDSTRPPVGRASTTAIWDVVRPAYSVWWLLTLSTAAGLLTLVIGSRRSRNAAAALASVWLVVAIGTAMGHGAEWRYSAQLAPITWMLASAGLAILVSSVFGRPGQLPGGR